MPKTALIRVTIPALDPDDDPTSNSFVFLGSGASDFSGIAALFTHVEHFYNNAGTGGTNEVAKYLGKQLDRGNSHALIQAYDITGHLDGSPHGSPVAQANWTLNPAAASSTIPSGCAVAVSWRSDYGTDVEFGPGTRPRSRDRNRVYLGPINSTALTEDGTTFRCKVNPNFVTDALAALFDLSLVTAETGDDWVLQTWSRKNAGTKLAVEGFMDDRPDYQRRRSDPGNKTFRPLSSV